MLYIFEFAFHLTAYMALSFTALPIAVSFSVAMLMAMPMAAPIGCACYMFSYLHVL